MSGSQKFLSRNRAPRVQIEYDVELYGAEKKVQLPFVMGVMSDLSGKSEVAPGSVADRKFLEIDIDNFDSRMKSMKPRAAFSVPNTLSGEGNLSVDLVFEKMSDFSPAEIARKVEPLRKLLEARTQLENLMTYMDGKAGAEELIEKLVGNPEQLRALALGAGDAGATAATFEAIKAAAPAEETPVDKSDDILASMAADTPAPEAAPDTSADVLAGLAASAPEAPTQEDTSASILEDMASSAPETAPEPDQSEGILAGMVAEAPAEQAPDTSAEDTLACMAKDAPEEAEAPDESSGILADMAADAPVDETPDTAVEDTLAGLAVTVGEDAPAVDESLDILAGVASEAPEEAAPDTAVDDMFSDMASAAPEAAAETEDSTDILAEMAEKVLPDALDPDQSEGVLAGLAAQAPEAAEEDTGVEDALASIAQDTPEEVVLEDESAGILAELAEEAPQEPTADTGVEDLLSDMASEAPDAEPEDDNHEDILAGIAEDVPEEAVDDGVDELLSEMTDVVPIEAPEESGRDDLLASMAEEAPEEAEDEDASAGVLADLASDLEEEAPEEDGLDDMLADMVAEAPEDGGEAEADDGLDELLADVAEDVPEEDVDDSLDILADMAEEAPEEAEAEDASAGVLADLASDLEEEAPEEDGLDDLLADVAEEAPEGDDEVEADGQLDNLLADLVTDAPAGEDDSDDDVLAGITLDLPEDEPEDSGVDDLLADLATDIPEEDTADELEDLLSEIAEGVEDDTSEEDGLEDVLAEMAADAPEGEVEEDNSLDILADLADEDETEAPDSGLDDLLADLAMDAPEDEAEDELEALLAGVADEPAEASADTGELDDLLAAMADEDASDADDDELEALLAGVADDTPEAAAGNDDLDDLLADLDEPDALADDEVDALAGLLGDDLDLDGLVDDADDDGLDDLLSESEDDDDLMALLGDDNEDNDIDDLLGGDDDLDDLGDLLGDEDVETAEPAAPKKPAFQPDFGDMTAAKLQDADGSRRKFRIAVLGDFSGRGNRGDLEIGAALGKRKAFKLDFDTMDDVIARFRTTLTLPLGNDGSAVEVELNELDDLHPDELFENVELFNELNMLRRDLKSGRNFEQNVERMKAWGGEFGDFKALSKKRSKGADAPADLRLSDFQNLIGDSTPSVEASSASDLISRIIGPHIVAAADNGSEAMIAAVDRALSTAMSSVLHHPDFQTIETAWRSIELLGRRVESSAELEVVVYDLSVEEFSADLAAQEDMAASGLFDMLVEKPRQDESAGPISAVVGLYTWEETPTHAELLARMARISAHMDAPFISAISTSFMGTKPEDRHPLVQKTWGALNDIPEAKYLGLASPRFMLRMPYGKKTEPLDRFDYEEFNLKEGMRSMLMANPALLVAVLLAETKAQQGGDMSLGSIMSLNDMPFHYMTDQYGDQVALPCTERLLSVSGAAEVIARRFMPVISVQGQNMVKLGSFQAVGGGELLGIWAGDSAKQMKSGKLQANTGVGISSGAKQVGAPAKVALAAGGDEPGGDDDDFDLDLGGADDFDLDLGGDDDLDLDLGLGDDDDDGLDDLLAGFGDDDDDDDDDMDADLAALLGDL